MIQVHRGFLDYLRAHSGAVHVQLRAAEPRGLALAALEAARRALFEVKHPEVPSDPFISFASEINRAAREPEFWFDAADAEAFDAVPEALTEAIRTALVAHGLTHGQIAWPDAPSGDDATNLHP
jgi:hypothetical protein